MLFYLFLCVYNTIEKFIEFIIYFYGESAPKVIQDSPESIYINKQKEKLLYTFEEGSIKSVIVNWNENIEGDFYNKKKIQETLKDVSNPIEKKWKSRILLENTPKGNIIMYYDAYKEGFAYYSNEIIPYPILNAVAMKYVVTYRCRDFFKDEVILPEPSPLVVAYRNQEKAEMKEKSRKISITKEELKMAPFLKRKKPDNDNDNEKDKEREKDKMINKFILYGKTNEFPFLKKVDKKKITINKILFQDLLENNDDFITESSHSSEETITPFSYKDYKNKMKRVLEDYTNEDFNWDAIRAS